MKAIHSYQSGFRCRMLEEELSKGRSSSTMITIAVAAYHRSSRLSKTLSCLLQSVGQLSIDVELLLLDNAETPLALDEAIRMRAAPQMVRVLYLNNPLWTLSHSRNWAFDNAARESELLLFLDSDIYMGGNVIELMYRELRKDPLLYAIAPPLYDEREGIRSPAMPDAYLLRHSTVIRNGVIQPPLLRGCYAINLGRWRENPVYFNPDFCVWQNVEFFLNVRESGFLFGSVLSADPNEWSIHDANPSSDDQRFSMPLWKEETVKSFVLLSVRHQLWLPRYNVINIRFIERMEWVLTSYKLQDVRTIMAGILQVAQRIASTPRHKALVELKQIYSTVPPIVRGACDILSYDLNRWESIRSLRTAYPEVAI